MRSVAMMARLGVVAGALLTLQACASYPTEPRYSTRPMPVGEQGPIHAPAGAPETEYPEDRYPNGVPSEPPPPTAAPVESIEGGALPPAGGVPTAPAPEFYSPPVASSPPLAPSAVSAGGAVAYVIQPGDTISGVGRRFQTPVQTLIDLNGLGPRGAINVGQRVRLPDGAVDMGPDPYATGPAPFGVTVAERGVTPPPPPPPSGNPAMPRPRPVQPPASPTTPAPAAPRPTPSTTASAGLQWPVRGDILRRFGPVGVGERNNGINIGASAGAAVNAAAAGRVAYVGDDLPGQGLTVLIVHRDGWRTVYGHLGSAMVDDGDEVRAGQQIGTVGLTAGDGRPSIHFETRRMQGDDPVAFDPLTVLPR